LATSVGATATLVAAARAIATNAENPLIDDQFAESPGPCRVIEFKSTTLAGLRAAPTADLRTVSIELRHD
jgi:O-methyltransferase involved in polyketide biosynthesis